MVNPSKIKGTAFESSTVDCLRRGGWVQAERRALSGALDKGDISGVAAGAVMIECKAHQTLHITNWLREVDAQTDNAGAAIGALWVKLPRRAGAENGAVVLRPEMFMRLLREAGY